MISVGYLITDSSVVRFWWGIGGVCVIFVEIGGWVSAAMGVGE